MSRILVCLILLCSSNFVYAEDVLVSTFNSKLKMNNPPVNIIGYEGVNRNRFYHPRHCHHCHNHINNYNNYNNLSALERHALNRTYRRENDLQRLERLEKLAFGAVQSGNVYNRYRNVESAILARPNYNTKRSIIGNIANYITGQATGFTPSIIGDDFSNFNSLGGYSNFFPHSGFNNSNYEQYSNGLFGGNGWGISGNSYNSGSSIKILD